RRLARERGIDLAALSGSGLGGRITKSDILALGRADAGDAARAEPLGGEDELLRISPVRRLIAQHMVRSTSTIPHATAFVEVDMTGLARRRAELREAFRRQEGFDLTYLPFVVRSATEALARFPVLNSEWSEAAIVRRGHVNIGIAVSLEESLVVPVIRDAAGQNVAQLARAIHALSERARASKLTLEDVRGGTFTVNNPGSFGTVLSLPIINEPQAAMLTMDAIVKRPVVVEGDAIAIRSMMFLGLAFDHRIVDGLIAGRFLAAAKAYLEHTAPTLDLEPAR
ncbi:MAG: dihydrolipoamide acetyltransferase family protein, partial [Chloroflexota bacterium]